MADKLKHIEYMSEMFDYLSKKYPNEDPVKIKKSIQKVVKQRIKNGKIEVAGQDLDFISFDKFIKENRPIISGSGLLLMTHDKGKNILGDMITYLSKKRKAYKALKFKYAKEGDDGMSLMYDIYQLTIKRLMNSFYGVLIQGDSIFFNPLLGPAVTQSGRDIITTSINCFETFLSNSIYFADLTDAIVYINRIINETYDLKGRSIKFKQVVSKKEVLEYLLSLMDEVKEGDQEILGDILDAVVGDNDTLYQHIYYKNNLIKLMDDSDIIDNYFSKLVGRKDFLDPNKIPEDMKETLDDIWVILENYVLYNYQEYYRWENVNKRKRRSILTINLSVA